MSNVIWINKPSILINEKYIYEIFPKQHMSKFRKINAITRLIIIITTLLFVFSQRISYLISGIVSLGLIYIITNNKKEPFKQLITSKNTVSELNSSNPLNNVMVGDDVNRESADKAYGPKNIETINNSVKQMIQEQNDSIDNINEKLFKDLGENFEFDRSMRQFYSTANTRIPNDQKGFAEYCYSDMVSGKEGDQSALIKNTIQLHSSHL